MTPVYIETKWEHVLKNVLIYQNFKVISTLISFSKNGITLWVKIRKKVQFTYTSLKLTYPKKNLTGTTPMEPTSEKKINKH